MSKTILLIENDAAFARELSKALEARGLDVAHSTDGKEGIELAKELGPAAVVLCVELPGMSGYSISNKLKKDERLRAIPLVLTSAEATPETFEAHKKLKARAEDYLLKPYRPADLIARLEGLIELPAAPAGRGLDEGEVEHLVDEDLGDAELSGETQARLRELDLADLPDEPMDGPIVEEEPASLREKALLEEEPGHQEEQLLEEEPIETEVPLVEAGPDEDADLKFLDDAFDGLSGGGASAAPSGVPAELASLFESSAAEPPSEPRMPPRQAEVPGRPDLGHLDEADRELEALRARNEAMLAMDALDDSAPEPSREHELPDPVLDLGPELAAALSLAPQAGSMRHEERSVTPPIGMPLLDPVAGASPAHTDVARLEGELTERRAALAAAEAEVRNLRARIEESQRRAGQAEAALVERDAELKTLRTRAAALSEQGRRDEEALEAAREEARRMAAQTRAAEDRARQAEERAAAAESRAAAASERAGQASERLSALEESARGQEAHAAATAEKARSAEALLAAARAAEEKARSSHAEASRTLEARAAELEELRMELLSVRGELDGLRAEAEKRAEAARKRIGELEATNSKNEERVVKAYLKIKGDEKLRDKARKALAIASQLLDDGLGAEPATRPAGSPPATTKLD